MVSQMWYHIYMSNQKPYKLYTIAYTALMALFLSACGGSSGGVSAAPGIPSGGSNPPGTKTWTIQLHGDGVGFTMNMVADQGDADEQFLSYGPIVIGVGQTVTYSVTGRNLDVLAVTRSSGVDVANGGPWLDMDLYENAVAIESQQLSTTGTFTTFQSR